MQVKIEKKSVFKIVGISTMIKNEEGYQKCPLFWDEFYAKDYDKYLCGMYGICIDNDSNSGYFQYVIGDNYKDEKLSDIFSTYDFDEGLWAIFSCVGPIPMALQSVNSQVYKEWLPNNLEYELAGNYSIEYYDDASKYKNGTKDNNYYCEIWLPVRKINKA